MHLEQKLLAGNGVRIDAVRDEEQIAVVLVELGALVERAGVVDRERVQPELLSELLQLLVGRILEVEPEESSLLEVFRDLVRIGVVQADRRLIAGARPRRTRGLHSGEATSSIWRMAQSMPQPSSSERASTSAC